MKTLFLKNGMPIATAILAIAGAFATTSMQSSSSAFAIKIGYTLVPSGECDVAVTCSDVPGPICRASYPLGPVALGKDVLGNCTSATVYRPM